jgi:hypothetical protein
MTRNIERKSLKLVAALGMGKCIGPYWEIGVVHLPENDTTYKYEAKYYSLPSKFGINGGRISKMNIRLFGENTDLYNYDRGLDVDCPNADVKAVLDYVLNAHR